MKIQIKPAARMRGTMHLPASKSISNRALIICALSQEGALTAASFARLQHISDCDDTQVMWDALTQGAAQIDIKAAGTAMRFLSAFLCTREGAEHVITGTARMRQRPIGVLVDALRRLGARVDYVDNEGFPPLRIAGRKLQGGQLELAGGVSSQYVSALLMIAPTLAEGLRLRLTGEIVSRPYIDMTLQIMQAFGARAAWEADDCLAVQPGGYRPIPYYIESDWSASSYWYEMVALSHDKEACVQLPALYAHSLQGDSAVRKLFARQGVSTTFVTDSQGVEGVRLQKQGCPAGRLDYDFTHQPDLAQTFVATCAALGVPFRFTGLQSLRIKETDRMTALRTELAKVGFDIEEADGSILSWDGQRRAVDHPLPFDTYEDHRMAMALAPLALRLGPLQMNDPGVVSKSYPSYWRHLEAVGFNIEEL